MSYKSVFTSAGAEASSARQAADHLFDFIPGARPEREGIDPELYEGIPETAQDPRIVSDRATVALNVVQKVISPMFDNFGATSASERVVTDDPVSTSKMASATVNEVATNVTESIPPENVVIPADQNPQNPDSVNHPPTSPNPQDPDSPTRPPAPDLENPQDPNSSNSPATPTTATAKKVEVEQYM